MTALLERDGELAALMGALDAARAGRGGCVLIAGEAGIGKTSLLRALRGRDAVEVLVGACEPLSVPVPLAPLRELAAAAGWPELPAFAGEDRFALARELLAALAARAPVVAAVEDAHWADPGTLDVVRLLSRWVLDAGVVLIVTYRDDEAHPQLTGLAGDLATREGVLRLAPAPLSADALRSLAAPSGADADELARVTGGNPFLVVESLSGQGGLPASVRDAILARAGRLSPSARAAAEAAAVVGHPVAPAVLAAIEPDGAAAGAVAGGVLTDDGQTLGFRHELIRQAIEGAIPAARRSELHARVAAALAATADHARLAHHAERAGLVADAAQYAERAAGEAERVGALSEAGRQLERALRLAPEAPAAQRVALLVRFARTENFAGRMTEACRAAEEAVRLAAGLGPAEEGRALNALAANLWSLERVDEARDAALRAVAVLEGGGDVEELARAHAAALRMEAVAFDPARAIAAAPETLAAAERAGLEEVRVDAAISLAVARGYRLEPGVLAALDAARADAERAGLHIQGIRARVNAIAIAADLRDAQAVDARAAEAVAHFEARQAAPPRDFTRAMVGRSQLDRGEFAAALEHVALARRTWHGGVVVADAVEALVLARRGEASDRLDAALQAVPGGARVGLLRAARAELAWLRGDLAAARAEALEGLATRHADQYGRSAGDLAVWAARSGATVAISAFAPAPARAELAGDWRGAIAGWRAVGAPYEAALAALPGDDAAAAEAMAVLRRLGANAAARAFARDRAARGAPAPRGPRRSTLANAAGLTRREQEVLVELGRGRSNAAIAAELHLSERTVAHHVSAVLGKLAAPNRAAAVTAARAAGLLAQDGQPRGAT